MNKTFIIVDMATMLNKRLFLAILSLMLLSGSLHLSAATGPTLLMDRDPQGSSFTGGIGPVYKYRRVKAPQNFGGDMNLWGIRAFGGKLRDPELGFILLSGTLNGEALKFNLDMAGLTLEDSFREDSRVKWRVSFGFGKYKHKTIASGLVLSDGSFTFFEPMILGVLPMSRHIILEFGAGYTFAGAHSGIRIEGLTLHTELLLGKF